MERPPVAEAQFVSHNSSMQTIGKGVFSGEGEAFMDPDVIEIPPPPASQNPRKCKQKKVIDIDAHKYEDSADVIILDEIVKTEKKRKAIKNYSDVSGSNQIMDSSKNSFPGSQSTINLDFYNDQLVDFDNNFMDVEHYAFLEAYFESVGIPAGVEVPLPCFSDPAFGKEKMVGGSKSMSLKPASPSSSSLQKNVDVQGHFAEVYQSSSWFFPQSAHDKNSPVLEDVGSSAPNPPVVENLSNLSELWDKSKSIGKPVASGISTNYNYVNQFDAMIFSEEDQSSLWNYGTSAPLHNQVGSSNLSYSGIPALKDTLNYPPPTGLFTPWLQGSLKPQLISTFPNYPTHPSFYDPSDVMHIPPKEGTDTPGGQDCIGNKIIVDEGDILRKFVLFKKFEAVEDHSDHHYASKVNLMKQPSNKWMKRIQEEWKILENDLPDTIFVRVYESRMDLLRAVIVGAEGTPYHDGLFFFDVFFPSDYPNVPPHVHYHSGGLRLNPNLYNCGKVCLSLLNTWTGHKNERWLPSVSTMLQVLVSIQALILNQKPYFNEPGTASMNGTEQGERQSDTYNENAFILSLKTMLCTVRRPPKHFKDFVMGHFYTCAHDILALCKAYMDGAQVGSVVKCGVRKDHVEKMSSEHLKNSLAGCINVLIKEFTQIGVKDCEKFLTQTNGGMPAK